MTWLLLARSGFRLSPGRLSGMFSRDDGCGLLFLTVFVSRSLPYNG
ncbi:hypothetical protein [Paenibacillus kobensis]|nr:hypothetical protein [Paenibacillus kobensis]